MIIKTDRTDYSQRLNAATIRQFARSLTGTIVVPGDRQYGKARRVWNRAVNRHPSVIVKCADETDVVRSLEFALRNEMLTAIRSGGHSFAGFGVCEDGMVIDVSGMKFAKVDSIRRRVTIEPGIIARELDCITQAFKMAVPLGSFPTVGVAVYALGG